MPVSPNFTSVYSHEWEINFTQCAPNGFLKYADLCNLLQLTAAEHSILGGLSFNDMQAFDQAWVLSRIRIEISGLPKWQDKVIVKTWIESLQGSSSTRNIEMWLDGKKIAGATSFWVVFNTKLRKAEALALGHDHFEKFPELHATTIPFSRINILKETQELAKRKVVLSDLDIVNHVNNVKYLEWCFDSVDSEFILKKQVQNLEMNFLRELNLGDDVEVNVLGDLQKPAYFSVTKNEKVCFAMAIDWV